VSRFLFVLPPFVGHVNPAGSLGRELSARGHTIGWVGFPVIRPLLPENDSFYPLPDVISQDELEKIRSKAGSRWLPGLKAFWEDIVIPLTRAMIPGVEAVIDQFRPDVIVADQQTLAGALAARRKGIPWATSSPSALMHSTVIDEYPLVRQWISDKLAGLEREVGLEPTEWADRSPDLILLYSTRAMIGDDVPLPEQAVLLGPVIDRRPEDLTAFPWDRLKDLPRVLVSLGTVNPYLGKDFYAAVIEAFRDEPVQVILNAPPSMLPSQQHPDNFIVQEWLPLLSLLKHVQVVVSHAGSTMNESLAHGVPLVVVPVAYDNFIFAQQAVNAGIGVRLKFSRLQPQDLRQAVFSVIENPAYRDAAARIQRDFKAAGGTARGASILEQFAQSVTTVAEGISTDANP
jgi:MGT family glycosyltransferase